MAINVGIYSNDNVSTKSIAIDFVADFLASSSNGVSDQTKYFFKFNTSARDTDNQTFDVKISESLSDLVLNNEKQRMVDTNAKYADIKTMILDYTYDFIYGHNNGEHGANVTEQKPMKF